MSFVPAGTVFDDPDTGERTEVLASPAETGDRYQVKLLLLPGRGGSGRHRHVDLTEEFTVLAGEVTFSLDGAAATLHRGDRSRAPAGRTHAVSNRGAGPAELEVDLVFGGRGPSPESDVVRFGAIYAAIAAERGRPGLLELALLFDEFPGAYVLPLPLRLQRLAIRPLAGLARRRGLAVPEGRDGPS
jgi:quercetin dioxygenase-like cupin family protein